MGRDLNNRNLKKTRHDAQKRYFKKPTSRMMMDEENLMMAHRSPRRLVESKLWLWFILKCFFLFFFRMNDWS